MSKYTVDIYRLIGWMAWCVVMFVAGFIAGAL